jgi:hypothetical protein
VENISAGFTTVTAASKCERFDDAGPEANVILAKVFSLS